MEENQKNNEAVKATGENKNSSNNENSSKQNPARRRSTLPYRLQYAINNAPSNLEKIKSRFEDLGLKNFDDAVAIEGILQLLDSNEELKSERRTRATQRKNRYKLDYEYGVYSASDVTSKSILALFRNIKRLNENQMRAIQERFLKNDISNVVGALDANSKFATDVGFIVELLLRKSRELSANGTYETESILKEIVNRFEAKDEPQAEEKEEASQETEEK